MKICINALLIFISSILIYSCRKVEKLPLPNVTTDKVTRISYKSAYVTGTLISVEEGLPLRGACYSTSENPTIKDSTVSGHYIYPQSDFMLEDLLPNTIYYTRAFVTTKAGTGYGEQVQFRTLQDYTGQTGSVTDADGNTYHTIGIGSQFWTVENLRTTKFLDGTPIQNITDKTSWYNASSPAYSVYNNDLTYKLTYGLLYNWYALDLTANNKKICPVGWHIPTSDEWNTLQTDLSDNNIQTDMGYKNVENKLRQAGSLHWTDGASNDQYTNITGFTILPGGSRNIFGYFGGIGNVAFLWVSNIVADSQPEYIRLDELGIIPEFGESHKKEGYSVRCIKDNAQ